MQDRNRLYNIILAALIICALGVTACVWVFVPHIPIPWLSVVWFIIFAASAELLAVGINEGNSIGIAPTSPVYWVATSVFGPAASIIICVVSALLGQIVCCVSYHVVNTFGLSDSAISCGKYSKILSYISNNLKKVGDNWYPGDVYAAIKMICWHAGNLVINAGLSGMVYYFVGGQFISESSVLTSVWMSFVFPFLALVAVFIAAEHSAYMIIMLAISPVPGVKGLYGAYLRAKLTFVEDVLPVWRGELFLVAVAIMLAYLYAHIGVWGFILAVMPMLALRDFFHQWVETKAAYLNTITTLATYMQHYHPYTRGHLKRVAEMSERLARELKLPIESIRHINTAGFLHDIGKIGVSEEILDKTGKLTDDEWDVIKEHPVKGAEIISHIEFLEGIVDWIKYHHKWYNGSGYPVTNGDGVSIPIEAAIIATADAFDAMTDDRELTMEWKCDTCGYKPENDSRPKLCPVCGAEKRRTYREPKDLDEAINELRRGAGTQFHPKVVKAFLTMVERDGIRLNA